MPLSTGATWPTLANRTASAADLTAKFEWAEGTRLPMANGVLANNTYDLGETASVWKAGYFNNIVMSGTTFTSVDTCAGRVRAYANVSDNGSTLTANGSWGIDSVLSGGFPGVYTLVLTQYDTGSAYIYKGEIATAINSVTVKCVKDRGLAQTAIWGGETRFRFYDSAGAYIHTNFNYVCVGDD